MKRLSSGWKEYPIAGRYVVFCVTVTTILQVIDFVKGR